MHCCRLCRTLEKATAYPNCIPFKSAMANMSAVEQGFQRTITNTKIELSQINRISKPQLITYVLGVVIKCGIEFIQLNNSNEF